MDKGKEILSYMKDRGREQDKKSKLFVNVIDKPSKTKEGRKAGRKERHKLPTLETKRDITRDHDDIKRIIREYYKQLHRHRFCTLSKMNQFIKKKKKKTTNYPNSLNMKKLI